MLFGLHFDEIFLIQYLCFRQIMIQNRIETWEWQGFEVDYYFGLFFFKYPKHWFERRQFQKRFCDELYQGFTH